MTAVARRWLLLDRYRNLPEDVTGAWLVALSERRRRNEVATTDRRDFSVHSAVHAERMANLVLL